MTTSPDYFSKTIEKGMRILEVFDQAQPSMSLKELSKITGINLTSTYRFVNTFEKLGYLRRDNRKKLLNLGPKAIALGNRLLSGFELSKIINPHLDEIHEKYNITIDASLFHEDTFVVIYRREAKNTLTFHPPIMRKSLYFLALGKSILAFLPNDLKKQILNKQILKKMTKNTVIKLSELSADLDKARNRGYALNNEEYIDGLISIGAPFFNLHTNRVIGSISFDSTTIQQPLRAFEKKYAKIIVKTAKDISELIQPFV
jgi:IclR family transcriptional regulator, pca regulon regulatory protein